MDTVKLAALLTAAELGSISKAAEKLGYTQSGVTHIISSLEDEAGFPLLVRGNRGVHFTAEGERLAPLIREVVQAAANLSQEVALTRGLERGTVRIGTYSSISMRWIPKILEAFQEKYPGISVELLEGNGPEIEEWLTTGRIDIAFTSLQPHFSFDTIRIQDDPMMAVVPRTHPMAKAEVFPIGRFKGEPFLVYMTSSNVPDEDLARAMRIAGIPKKAKLSSNFDVTILSMVEHNLGVTIMPKLILEGSTADVAAIPLDPPLKRTLGMAMRAGRAASPAMRRMIECTKAVLGI